MSLCLFVRHYSKLYTALSNCLAITSHAFSVSKYVFHENASTGISQIFLDKKQVLDHKFRTKISTDFAASKLKSRRKIKKIHHLKTHDFLLEFRTSERRTHNTVILTVDSTTYYINIFPNFARHALRNKLKIKTVNNMLFTRLDWHMAICGVSNIARQEAENFSTAENNKVCTNICVPHGMKDVILSSLPVGHSVKSRNRVTNTMFFQDYHGDSDGFKTGNLKIKVVNLTGSEILPSVINADSFDIKGIVNSYIFEYNVNSDLSIETPVVNVSWKNFSEVEDYIVYLKEIVGEKKNNEPASTTKENIVITTVVLDCPNDAYFRMMLRKNEILNHHKSISKVNCIVHMSPAEVYKSEQYQKWMSEFGTDCTHIMLDDVCSKITNISRVHVFRGLLHTIDPCFFPLHGNRKVLQVLQDWLCFSLLPYKKHHNFTTDLNTGRIFNSLGYTHFSKDMLGMAKPLKNIFSKTSLSISKVLYPRLIVLGSGGSIATLYRSPPCYLLFIDENTSIMLDCGTETIEQLYCHFGDSQVAQALSTIKTIVITHKHSDHWSGLLLLLEEMQLHKHLNNLLVVLPLQIKNLMRRIANSNATLLNNVDLIETEYNSDFNFYQTMPKIQQLLKLKSFKMVRVDHGVPTFGVILELFSGEKIVYSSDTLPMCKKLIEEGKNADLLIHDSLSLDDKDVSLTTMKMHSTMRGAIATAQSMKAKNVMLTHFSASCKQLPLLSLHHDEPYDGNILYAMDHLEMPLCQLHQFSSLHEKLLPVFNSIYVRSDSKEIRFATQQEQLQNVLKMHSYIQEEFKE